MKKPNLSTVEAHLSQSNAYTFGGTTVSLARNGFFTVTKHGESRTYSRLVDAWRAM